MHPTALDPRTNVSVADYAWLPVPLQPAFQTTLEGPDGIALVHWAAEVELREASEVRRRVILLGSEALYVCLPNTDVCRYCPLDVIEAVLVCDDWLCLVCPSAYDVCFRITTRNAHPNCSCEGFVATYNGLLRSRGFPAVRPQALPSHEALQRRPTARPLGFEERVPKAIPLLRYSSFDRVPNAEGLFVALLDDHKAKCSGDLHKTAGSLITSGVSLVDTFHEVDAAVQRRQKLAVKKAGVTGDASLLLGTSSRWTSNPSETKVSGNPLPASPSEKHRHSVSPLRHRSKADGPPPVRGASPGRPLSSQLVSIPKVSPSRQRQAHHVDSTVATSPEHKGALRAATADVFDRLHASQGTTAAQRENGWSTGRTPRNSSKVGSDARPQRRTGAASPKAGYVTPRNTARPDPSPVATPAVLDESPIQPPPFNDAPSIIQPEQAPVSHPRDEVPVPAHNGAVAPKPSDDGLAEVWTELRSQRGILERLATTMDALVADRYGSLATASPPPPAQRASLSPQRRSDGVPTLPDEPQTDEERWAAGLRGPNPPVPAPLVGVPKCASPQRGQEARLKALTKRHTALPQSTQRWLMKHAAI